VSPDDLVKAEQLARRIGPANCWTGSGGTLASLALAMIRELKERTVKEQIGESVKFDTGAVRSAEAEATRYDLVSPIGLEAVARTCAEGAAKYGDWNWEKGMPVHDLLNHALRHIYRYLAGDRSEPHLPHAAWGLLAAIHSDELWPHLNDGTLRGPGCTPPPAGNPPCSTASS
jgi:hypothetical protein